jgi:hypothetical protein
MLRAMMLDRSSTANIPALTQIFYVLSENRKSLTDRAIGRQLRNKLSNEFGLS